MKNLSTVVPLSFVKDFLYPFRWGKLDPRRAFQCGEPKSCSIDLIPVLKKKVVLVWWRVISNGETKEDEERQSNTFFHFRFSVLNFFWFFALFFSFIFFSYKLLWFCFTCLSFIFIIKIFFSLNLFTIYTLNRIKFSCCSVFSCISASFLKKHFVSMIVSVWCEKF